MSVLYIIACIFFILLSVGIVIMILMQDKKSGGLSSSMAGMGASQTYWDKNKGRSLEGALEKYTKIAGAVFVLLGLVFPFIIK